MNVDMARQGTLAESGNAKITPRAAGAHRRSSRIVKDWYTQRLSTFWCAINIIGAFCTAAIGWDYAPHAVVVAWLLFTSLNATLYMAISHEVSYWFFRSEGGSDTTQIAMALAFGVIWGSCFLLFAPYLPSGGVFLLSALCLFISVLALPVFAIHRRAYVVFALFVAVLAVIGLRSITTENDIALFASVFLVGMLVIAKFYSKFIGVMMTSLTNFAHVAANDADDKINANDMPLLLDRNIRIFKRLDREQRRASATLDAIGEAILTTTEAGLIDYMNPVAEVLTGVQFNDAKGQRIEAILNLSSHGGENLISALIQSCRAGMRINSTGERTVLKRGDGIEYDVEYQLAVIRNNSQEITGFSCLVRDVTAKHNLIEHVAWRTTHDPLTNLINRTEFEQRIGNVLNSSAHDSGKRHALLFIDFDHFKFLNETHGVEGGDHVLKSIAVELKQKIRGADTLARIGEDKFGVLLYSCPIDKAALIAEGLRRLVADFQATWDGKDLSISISIGAIEIDPAVAELSDVLGGAESACALAKSDGGNRVHVFHTDDPQQRQRTDSTERLREIQSAIRSNRLELFVQNISPIQGGNDQPRICELQLRMQDGQGKLLSPRDFLVATEHYQLMPEIDRWRVKAAIDALRAKHPALNNMDTICINISGRSINDDRFLEFIVGLLDEEIDNDRICFEISDASLISSTDHARHFVAKLKDLGCQVALDDFGLGMSSLALLKCLPVDYLKIGGCFIRDMSENSVDYEIVLALIRIARTMRVKTIAVGVTTLATKDSLFAMGVDYVQGSFIDPPYPLSLDSETLH